MEGFDIFGDDALGGEGLDGIVALMATIGRHIEENGMSAAQGVQILFDAISPGVTDSSTDIRAMWAAAMYAYGFGEVAKQFPALYLNQMPWGVGFAISVEPDFEFKALSTEAQRAIINSLAVVLRMGGIECTVSDDNRIVMMNDEGNETTISMDDLVTQFRTEMEDELPKLLGDDKPDDPWRRWLR